LGQAWGAVGREEGVALFHISPIDEWVEVSSFMFNVNGSHIWLIRDRCCGCGDGKLLKTVPQIP